MGTAAFLNIACEAAGVGYRVAEQLIDRDDPDAVARYGETMVDLATRQWPVPWFDNRYTRSQLDYHPVALRPAIDETVNWLRGLGQID